MVGKVFALIDCNAFYVSCERVFNPKLNNRPVVALSNNDGCIISRSKEAKALGIKMGVPLFKVKDIVKNQFAGFDDSDDNLNRLYKFCLLYTSDAADDP